MSDEREPLWSDTTNAIRANVKPLPNGDVLWTGAEMEALRQVLDEKDRRIADAATVAEQVRDAYEARIAALEQELAQRWEPVNEKFILTYDTGLVDTPKQFARWNADDESVIVGKDDGSFYHCPLPDNIRLCRLVERAEPQAQEER